MRRIPVRTEHQPLGQGLGGVDFGALGALPDGPADQADLNPEPPTKSGRVVLRREKSGRGGKVVVVVSGFESQWTEQKIEDLARAARQRSGCGGAFKNREIELQGDIAPRVREFFESQGFRVAGV